MVVIERVDAKSVPDSRNEETISVSIKTNAGSFSSSAPNGKSTGKSEAKPYKKSLKKDIETLKKFSEYFSDDIIDNFSDLRRIEDIVDGHIGANTLFALESCVLKALAKEKKSSVWNIVFSRDKKDSNKKSKKKKKVRFPRLVGNVVGGGKHSAGAGEENKKPDFQEFLLIPRTHNVKDAFEKNKKAWKKIKSLLEKKDENFSGDVSDENAWTTSLNDKQVLDILKEFKMDVGVDVAASSFHKRKKYHYKNPRFKRTQEEHFSYVSNLIRNFNLFYVEDPLGEDEFSDFAELLKKFPNSLIVGDDLTTTNPKRFEKALRKKSINAIIVKPNQIGSLLSVAKVCNMAKKNKIKIVFSHRSGETQEDILADLAFGFQADFLKCGVTGKGREIKIKRLIKIQKDLRKNKKKQ